MNNNTILSQLKEQAEEILESFKSDLTKIHTGRATPSLLEDVKVDAYNSLMGLKELAAIRNPEPRQLLVEPWDEDVLENIDHALREADLGGSILVEDSAVRVVFPKLTFEDREDLARKVTQRLEEAKQAVRKVRQDARDQAEDLEDEEGEDFVYRLKETIEERIQSINDNLEEVSEAKKKAIRS
ncbi:MAG: ribosome-recycling factor [Patescibacteria group bacterium]